MTIWENTTEQRSQFSIYSICLTSRGRMRVFPTSLHTSVKHIIFILYRNYYHRSHGSEQSSYDVIFRCLFQHQLHTVKGRTSKWILTQIFAQAHWRYCLWKRFLHMKPFMYRVSRLSQEFEWTGMPHFPHQSSRWLLFCLHDETLFDESGSTDDRVFTCEHLSNIIISHFAYQGCLVCTFFFCMCTDIQKSDVGILNLYRMSTDQEGFQSHVQILNQFWPFSGLHTPSGTILGLQSEYLTSVACLQNTFSRDPISCSHVEAVLYVRTIVHKLVFRLLILWGLIGKIWLRVWCCMVVKVPKA